MLTVEEQKTLLQQIIKQLSGEIDETKRLVPEYTIPGKGYLFCLQPSSRSFIKINKNQKVFVLDQIIGSDKLLIYTSCGKIVEIHKDKLYLTDSD